MTDHPRIPFTDGWVVTGYSDSGGAHRFDVTNQDNLEVVVEFLAVNTMRPKPTAQINLWLPGEDQPYRERTVEIGDTRTIRTLVQAWDSATSNATTGMPLFQIIRYLSDAVLKESETVDEVVNLSTGKVTDETRRIMYEPDLLDEQLTSLFGQPSAGKSKFALALAADISHDSDNSFLGFRYPYRRPVLYLDWEEFGEKGEDAFRAQLDAVCDGHGIDRDKTAVFYFQPKTTFARALPEIIAKRDEIAKRYGVMPVTVIDSVTKATGGNSLSYEGWADFDNACRLYRTTILAVDHEVKSDAGQGRLGGVSPKIAAYRHTVYVSKDGPTLTLASKKSNRLEERPIATFTVEVDRMGTEVVQQVRYRNVLTTGQASGEDDREQLTTKNLMVMWAYLTDTNVSNKSYETDAVENVFKQRPGETRNHWTKLVGLRSFEQVGDTVPKEYRLTSTGTEEARKLLAANPEVRKRYDEWFDGTGGDE